MWKCKTTRTKAAAAKCYHGSFSVPRCQLTPLPVKSSQQHHRAREAELQGETPGHSKVQALEELRRAPDSDISADSEYSLLHHYLMWLVLDLRKPYWLFLWLTEIHQQEFTGSTDASKIYTKLQWLIWLSVAHRSLAGSEPHIIIYWTRNKWRCPFSLQGPFTVPFSSNCSVILWEARNLSNIDKKEKKFT